MEYAQYNTYACMKTLLNNKEIKNIEIFNINKDPYECKNKNKTDTPPIKVSQLLHDRKELILFSCTFQVRKFACSLKKN